MSEPDAEYNVARADDAARPLAKGRATRAGILTLAHRLGGMIAEVAESEAERVELGVQVGRLMAEACERTSLKKGAANE